MAIESTEAVALRLFNWSESSRTIVVLSRRFGRIALIDKAGRSIKSKRGRVLPFAVHELAFYQGEGERRNYLSGVDTMRIFSFAADGSLGKLAYGSAANELCLTLLPEDEPHPEIYTYLLTFYEHLEAADRLALPGLFLTFLLRSASLLGYHPQLNYCAECSRPIPQEETLNWIFDPARGGIVCPGCAAFSDTYIPVSPADLLGLAAYQRASLSEADGMQLPFEQGQRLLEVMLRFLEYHAGVNSQLKALGFLDKLKRAQSERQ